MRFIIPNTAQAADYRRFACDSIRDLPKETAWEINIKKYSRKRSLEQNSYLWAVPLTILSDHTGYEKVDIKDYLLMQCFGAEEIELFGEKQHRPAKGTSQLTVSEFNEFLEFITRWASQNLDLSIPEPMRA